MFALRSVDESSNASFTTASTNYEYDSETTSHISDSIDNLSGLHELFTDWIDNAFDLNILFEEQGFKPAISPEPSPMPLKDPDSTHQSEDVIDLEPPATFFSTSSAIPYPYDLIDLCTLVANYQISSTSGKHPQVHHPQRDDRNRQTPKLEPPAKQPTPHPNTSFQPKQRRSRSRLKNNACHQHIRQLVSRHPNRPFNLSSSPTPQTSLHDLKTILSFTFLVEMSEADWSPS